MAAKCAERLIQQIQDSVSAEGESCFVNISAMKKQLLLLHTLVLTTSIPGPRGPGMSGCGLVLDGLANASVTEPSASVSALVT